MDRISKLPDELLVKILLLVPTKVAVSTSILSKRWEYLWMWLPKLDYGRKGCSRSECKRLRSFLHRNLPLHKAPVIESFRLELCNPRFKPENINMWVVIALSRCLRELDILYESYPAKPDILPSNLYTCKSLVVLKLEGDILLDVPRMASLPSLKTLELQSVKYLSEETLQRLLSSCPTLENLVVFLRDGDTTRKLTIVVPSLQKLSLSLTDQHDIDGFVIETPALKYFKLMDYNYESHYCLVEHMPNLIEAHLDVELPDIKSLMGSITSVNRLSICAAAMLDEGFVFKQLEHLELCTCKEHLSNQLFRLLNASSNLQGLHLFFMKYDHDSSPREDIGDWIPPTTVPECMMSSLQSLSWSQYLGEPHDVGIVVYILKHALHLETATIESSRSSLYVPDFEELALSSRASATCQLMFD